MLAASRPGYVYLLANPSLPGWHKVGHTHRPPHRRAAELSRTALPTAFEVAFARFFWDAPAAEQCIHRALEAHVSAPRRKEFFLVHPDQAAKVIQAVEDAGRHGPAAPRAGSLRGKKRWRGARSCGPGRRPTGAAGIRPCAAPDGGAWRP